MALTTKVGIRFLAYVALCPTGLRFFSVQYFEEPGSMMSCYEPYLIRIILCPVLRSLGSLLYLSSDLTPLPEAVLICDVSAPGVQHYSDLRSQSLLRLLSHVPALVSGNQS
jgi:hypothetical protein